MAAQRIKLRIDCHPKHPGIFQFDGLRQEFQRRFGAAEGRLDQRDVIRRDVSMRGELSHLSQNVFRLLDFAGPGIGGAEASHTLPAVFDRAAPELASITFLRSGGRLSYFAWFMARMNTAV